MGNFTTPVLPPPKTFEQRVAWAIQTRTAFVVGNEGTRHIKPPTFDEYDDEEGIRISVRAYENKVTRIEEKVEKEKREKEEEGGENALQEFFRKHPGFKEKFMQPNEASKPKSTKKRSLPESDDDEYEMAMHTSRPKSYKIATKTGILPGKEYDVPCEQCRSRGRDCHEQNPPRTSCYECRMARIACPLVPMDKKIPRGANRKAKEIIEESDDEIVQRPRRSTRHSEQCSTVDTINEVASEIRNMTQVLDRVVGSITAEMKASNKILKAISPDMTMIAHVVRVAVQNSKMT